MRHSIVDFNSIERALLYSIEELEKERNPQDEQAFEELMKAQEELKRAFSISMSRRNGP